SSVSQTQATSIGRSDTRSTESSNTTSQEFGAEIGYGATTGWSGKATFSAGFEQSSARGFSSTVDTQTSRESQQSFEESASEALETSELRSVTRTIDSASVLATVNVANQGSIPFTITNIELSLLRQD